MTNGGLQFKRPGTPTKKPTLKQKFYSFIDRRATKAKAKAKGKGTKAKNPACQKPTPTPTPKDKKPTPTPQAKKAKPTPTPKTKPRTKKPTTKNTTKRPARSVELWKSLLEHSTQILTPLLSEICGDPGFGFREIA